MQTLGFGIERAVAALNGKYGLDRYRGRLNQRWLMRRDKLGVLAAVVTAASSGLPLTSQSAQAGISVSGDYAPFYFFQDPWNISGGLDVGITGIGTITVNSGSDVTASGTSRIGENSGSNGTLRFVDSGTTADFASSLLIGDNGVGRLEIENGAFVEANNTFLGFGSTGQGTMILDGSGSEFNGVGSFYVADASTNGTSSVSVINGGFLDIASFIVLGDKSGSSGSMVISGADSEVEGSLLYVGDQGTGDLNHLGGLLEVFNDAYVAWLPGSNGDIDVNGLDAEVQVFRNFYVGGTASADGGLGDFDVFDGRVFIGDINRNSVAANLDGLFVSDDDTVGGDLVYRNGATGTISEFAYIGYESDENGSITSRGSGTNIAFGLTTYVGYNGEGTLNATDGGVISLVSPIIGNFAGSNGTVNVDGAGSQITYSSTFFNGAEGTGMVNVTNGGVLSGATMILGSQPTGNGTINVSGTGSRLSASFIGLGDQGTGQLNVSTGGEVFVSGSIFVAENPGSTGGALIDGVNSLVEITENLYLGHDGTNNGGTATWIQNNGITAVGDVNAAIFTQPGLYLDDSSSVDASGGILDMRNGATANINGRLRLGVLDGNSGKVIMRDEGTSLTVSDFAVIGDGQAGSVVGALEISNGADLIASGMSVGAFATATGQASIDGAGSSVTLTSQYLAVGEIGQGTLDITNGASVMGNASSDTNIGLVSGSTGTVTVDGAGSLLYAGDDLSIGDRGTGTLNITNGGTVTADGGVSLGNPSLGDGGNTINIDGENSSLVAGSLSQGQTDNNVINVTNGGLIDVGDFIMNSGGTPSTATINVTNGGTIQAIGSPAPATSLMILAGSSVATVNTTLTGGVGPNGTASLISDRIYVASTSSAISIGTATLNIGFNSIVDATDAFFAGDNATINLFGGEIEADSIGFTPNTSFNFLFGTIHDTSDLTLDTTFSQTVFNSFTPSISTNQTLEVDGNLTLLTPTALNGGTLAFGTLTNGSLLTWNSGTVVSGQPVSASTGPYGSYLNLSTGKTLQNTVVDNLLIAADGSVELTGGRITGEAFEVSGILRGHGRVETGVQVNGSGQVRVNTSQRLFVQSLSNVGTVNVTRGELEVDGLATNNDSGPSGIGVINADGAILQFNSGLDNNSVLTFSGTNSTVTGDINNESDGRVVVTGGTIATFNDDFANSGTFEVTPNATAVILGSYSGNGIGGGGTVNLVGDTRPGFSPGVMEYDLELLSMSSDHELYIELGGLGLGEFDRLENTGDILLDGELQVSFIDGYTPSAGELFEFVVADSISGELDYTPTALGNGLSLELVSPGTLAVVPEPVSVTAFVGVGVILLRRRRS